jgi:hypothetical protein
MVILVPVLARPEPREIGKEHGETDIMTGLENVRQRQHFELDLSRAAGL